MKTPMQILIEQIKELKYARINEEAWGAYDAALDVAESMLEKEKEVIKNAVRQGWDYNEAGLVRGLGEKYYNETFNTKEK